MAAETAALLAEALLAAAVPHAASALAPRVGGRGGGACLLTEDASEHLTHARFSATRAQGFAEAAGLLAPLFNKRLTADERRELVGMVEEIARIDGGPSAAQTEAIDVLRRKTGLATATP